MKQESYTKAAILRCFQIGVFVIFTGKHLCGNDPPSGACTLLGGTMESLFNKVADLKACYFVTKRLQHSCFSVNIAKFKTSFFHRKPPVAAFGYSNQSKLFEK